MKLNYKHIFYIGIIFFIISLFWQTYDMMIARTLIDKYGLNQTWSGIVMALDNVMAVILLPLFGAISDKSNAKLGRRTPYIIFGTILATFSFMALAYTDYIQTLKIQSTDIVENHYQIAFNDDVDSSDRDHWYIVLDHMTVERLDRLNQGYISGKIYDQFESNVLNPLVEILDQSDATLSNRNLAMVKDLYYRYLSERAWEVTRDDPTNLIVFGAILFVALVAMAIFRSPAVALMPDITIKPLRSKANAIITLMGAIGGMLAIYIMMVSGLNKNAYDHHAIVYILVGVVMIFALAIFLWKVNEPKLVREKRLLDEKLELTPESELKNQKSSLKDLTFRRRISLYFLLAAVFLIFMGYNAVMSKIADYLPKQLNMNFFEFQFVIAQAVIILAIIPIGILSMKIGRKRTVVLGMVLMIFSLSFVYFLQENQHWLTAFIIMIAGMGWTMIGINTYVMVVELSKGYDVGRYTGYYYASSMTAQIFTPIISGILMDQFGRLILFPYAAFFTVLALIVMIFVKRTESPKISKNILENLEVETNL